MVPASGPRRDPLHLPAGHTDLPRLRGHVAALAAEGRPLVLTSAETDPEVRAALATLGDVADVRRWSGLRGRRVYIYSASDRAALGL